jgi:alpha-beta hydrolase superfamily lysophospholipase
LTHSTIDLRKSSRTAGFLRKSTIIAAIVMVIYFSVALGLIYWPHNTGFAEPPEPDTASYSTPVDFPPTPGSFSARDGTILSADIYGQPSGATVLLVHGIAADKAKMAGAAQRLFESTDSQIIALDLRGHGLSGGDRNDVDYIGQYEDDIADVMRALLAQDPDREIVLAGHSMGGGIITRYAMKKGSPVPAGYLLFAPNFGEGPTQRKDDTGTGEPGAKQVDFNLARMIGLIMLNAIGIHALDHEPILYFNFPPRPSHYSYRAVMSGQPVRPATADVALSQMNRPLLVLVGERDQVFKASAYPEYISQHSSGETHIIPGADHEGILASNTGFDFVKTWFRREFPVSSRDHQT